jgi:hypothetical protein
MAVNLWPDIELCAGVVSLWMVWSWHFLRLLVWKPKWMKTSTVSFKQHLFHCLFNMFKRQHHATSNPTQEYLGGFKASFGMDWFWTFQGLGFTGVATQCMRASNIVIQTLWFVIWSSITQIATQQRVIRALSLQHTNRQLTRYQAVFDAKFCRVSSAHSRLVCYPLWPQTGLICLRQDAAKNVSCRKG